MTDGWESLIGGFAQGFGNAKNAAKERAVMDEYRKAMTEHVKTQAKHEESKINLEMLKYNMMKPILEQAMGKPAADAIPALAPPPGGGLPQGQPPAIQPQSMMTPGGQSPSTPLPMQIAQGQNQFNGLVGAAAQGMSPLDSQFPINIPGNPANNISARQNNPGNLKFVGQEGAQPGTRDFAIFSSPQEGFNALQKQIDIDKGRNLTLSQFANKYAPPFENDTNNWIKNVANMTGASPDTPLVNIATPDLAKAVAKVESSTTIGGQPQGQLLPSPTQRGYTQTQPVQNVGIPRTISQADALGAAWKFFTGAELKDEKYDYRIVNKDIVVLKNGEMVGKIAGGPDISWHAAPNGDMVALDSKSLKPLQVIPMPAEMVKVDGHTATGAPFTGWTPKPKYPDQSSSGGLGTPQTQFQSPDSMPGGLTGGIVTGPSAIEGKITQGIPVADVGRTNMIMHAESKLNDVNDLLVPNGKVDRIVVAKAAIPGGGLGEGTTLYSRMYQAVDAALRLETGAQANSDEIKVKMWEYWPSIKDTNDVIIKKNKDLNEYIRRTVNLHDPTGKLREAGRNATGGSTPSLGAFKPTPQLADPLGLRQ